MTEDWKDVGCTSWTHLHPGPWCPNGFTPMCRHTCPGNDPSRSPYKYLHFRWPDRVPPAPAATSCHGVLIELPCWLAQQRPSPPDPLPILWWKVDHQDRSRWRHAWRSVLHVRVLLHKLLVPLDPLFSESLTALISKFLIFFFRNFSQCRPAAASSSSGGRRTL
jgi:hypothetical protein